VAAIVRKEKITVARSAALVQRFLQQAEIEVVSIDTEIGLAALKAFDRYGKGRGHKAQLNLCECFAYAMAKQHGVPLLYTGDDFSQTDLA
jgi:ribonuclease VapC